MSRFDTISVQHEKKRNYYARFLFIYFEQTVGYIYIYIYIYLICIYLYFYVEVLLLVFSVICMHQGSESNAISILCMYVRYMWQN